MAMLLDRYRPYEGPGEEDPFFNQERATVHRLLKFDEILAQWTRANESALDAARREGVEFGIRIPTGGSVHGRQLASQSRPTVCAAARPSGFA